jgi:hypothetical protein
LLGVIIGEPTLGFEYQRITVDMAGNRVRKRKSVRWPHTSLFARNLSAHHFSMLVSHFGCGLREYPESTAGLLIDETNRSQPKTTPKDKATDRVRDNQGR